jgi:hypothetical protein
MHTRGECERRDNGAAHVRAHAVSQGNVAQPTAAYDAGDLEAGIDPVETQTLCLDNDNAEIEAISVLDGAGLCTTALPRFLATNGQPVTLQIRFRLDTRRPRS